jgi:hypothetical protein
MLDHFPLEGVKVVNPSLGAHLPHSYEGGLNVREMAAKLAHGAPQRPVQHPLLQASRRHTNLIALLVQFRPDLRERAVLPQRAPVVKDDLRGAPHLALERVLEFQQRLALEGVALLLQAFPHGRSACNRLALGGALVTRLLVATRENVAEKARPGGDDEAKNGEPAGNRCHAPSIDAEADGDGSRGRLIRSTLGDQPALHVSSSLRAYIRAIVCGLLAVAGSEAAQPFA